MYVALTVAQFIFRYLIHFVDTCIRRGAFTELVVQLQNKVVYMTCTVCILAAVCRVFVNEEMNG